MKRNMKEYKFYIAMYEEDRQTIKDNMKRLRGEHGLTLSEVLRKVMIHKLNDEDFLKIIGAIDTDG